MIQLLVHHKIVRKLFHLILTSFFILVTAKQIEKADILYYCKVYYEEKATFENEWEIMFTVVKHLNALQQVRILHMLICCVYLYYFSISNDVILMLRKVRKLILS